MSRCSEQAAADGGQFNKFSPGGHGAILNYLFQLLNDAAGTAKSFLIIVSVNVGLHHTQGRGSMNKFYFLPAFYLRYEPHMCDFLFLFSRCEENQVARRKIFHLDFLSDLALCLRTTRQADIDHFK